jgi:hypothetical protein
MLLLRDDKDLQDQVEATEDRLAHHLALESDRRKAGLSTDAERWQRTGEAMD